MLPALLISTRMRSTSTPTAIMALTALVTSFCRKLAGARDMVTCEMSCLCAVIAPVTAHQPAPRGKLPWLPHRGLYQNFFFLGGGTGTAAQKPAPHRHFSLHGWKPLYHPGGGTGGWYGQAGSWSLAGGLIRVASFFPLSVSSQSSRFFLM